MDVSEAAQRWVRPLDFLPGHWKKQLAGKYLAIAARGDTDGLRQVLAQHPEYLSKRGPHGRTFLWEAARKGRLATVQWLVEQGADIDATGSYNQESYLQISPYCAAIYYSHDHIAAYLLEQGAQLDIFRAAFVGDLDSVSAQLDHNPDLLNAEDPHDEIYYVPLLAFPFAGGQRMTAELLLDRGADVHQYSAQLLSIATMVSCLDLIELLVAYGARVETVDTGIFILASDVNIMRYLLEHGASPNRVGRSGFPPLMHISRGDKGEHAEKIQLLIDYGANVNAVAPKGRTALHYAAKAGFSKVVQLLLDHGADTTLKDDEGNTPLDLARTAEKLSVVRLLMSR